MTSFSERYGYKPDRSRLYQFEEMDGRLRNAIWNFLRQRFFAYENDSMLFSPADRAMKEVWTAVIGRSVDDLTSGYHALAEVRSWYFGASWNEVYDVLQHLVRTRTNSRRDADNANLILSREGSAYRFIGDVITPITSDGELTEIEDAIRHSGPFSVAAEHIRRAVALLGERGDLDTRNVIKEAISAVESAAKVAAGDPTADINKALKRLDLHPQLEQAWKNMYNWTSDEGGLRHGKSEMSQVGVAEARYMVVACSAFVNYLIAKSSDEDSN